MNKAVKNILIIYLDKNRLDLYGTNGATALSVVFPQDVIKDMEVINEESLTKLISDFITQNKLPPSHLILILSENICFTQEFSSSPDGKQDEEIQKFLESVPFEHISSKRISLPQGIRLVSTNKDLYESIKNIFAKHNFVTIAVIPSMIVGNISSQNGLDQNTQQFIIDKFDSFKGYSLLEEQSAFGANVQGIATPLLSPKNRRLLILLSVFLLLIFILIFTIIISTRSSTPTTQLNTISPTPFTTPIPPASADITPEVTLAPSTASPSSPLYQPQITP